MAANNRGRNQVKSQVERPTHRTAKKEESPEIWAKPAPHCGRLHEKLEELYRSHGSDMTRLVTAVKQRLFEQAVPFGTQKTLIFRFSYILILPASTVKVRLPGQPRPLGS